jgi:hypothetical protein
MTKTKSIAIQLCALIATLLTISIGSVTADATYTPILPPSYPLAVRNPCLSGKFFHRWHHSLQYWASTPFRFDPSLTSAPAWLPGNGVANLPSAVAQFWQGQQLTWSVIARVNGKTYSLFGVPRPGDDIQPGSLTSADFSATHTTFTVTASDVKFVLDFFSPMSPHNYVRQSMPFSYLTVSTSSLNSGTPSVQIYSDMDNSWVGQFGDNIQLDWNWAATQEITQVFTLSQNGTAKFSEEADMALWGTAAYCTRENASKLSNAVGNVDEVRNSFATNDNLAGGGDFRPGSVFAYSHDLGSLQNTENVTFVIGHVRDPAVSYHGGDRSSYWQSVCKDINCGCVHALDDLHAADEESRNLDAYLASTKVGSANHSDILVLSTRQTFGALELTIPSDSLDANSVLALLKEISRFVFAPLHDGVFLWPALTFTQ